MAFCIKIPVTGDCSGEVYGMLHVLHAHFEHCCPMLWKLFLNQTGRHGGVDPEELREAVLCKVLDDPVHRLILRFHFPLESTVFGHLLRVNFCSIGVQKGIQSIVQFITGLKRSARAVWKEFPEVQCLNIMKSWSGRVKKMLESGGFQIENLKQ